MKPLLKVPISLLAFLFLPFAGALSQQESSKHTFNPDEIQILMNPDVDIVYHVLAYFSVPGDPSNLYSADYLQQIRKAKQDLEVGQTKLDLAAPQMEKAYRLMPRLRFLNLALFMADDFVSFKQALSMIDFNFRTEAQDSRESLEQRKAKEGGAPLLFGNSKRLIPLLRNRFPDPQERQFLKQFAECLEDERSQFYKVYREARGELDQQSFDRFQLFWKSEGVRMLQPWVAKSGVNVFNIYLCPVMKRNGRGVPVNQEQSVLFNVVAPLPDTKDQLLQVFFVILHETTHRITDLIVDSATFSSEDQQSISRENAVFYADHVYLKGRFPQHHLGYLKFFLSLENSKSSLPGNLENEFLKSYPLAPALKSSIDQAVKDLQ